MALMPKHGVALYCRDGNLQRRLGRLRETLFINQSLLIKSAAASVVCSFFLFTDIKTISLSLSISTAVIIRTRFQSHYPHFPFTHSVLQP